MLWGILIIVINTHIYRRKMNRIDLARDLVITLKGLCFYPIFQWNTQIPAKWLSNETTLAKCPSDHNICPPKSINSAFRSSQASIWTGELCSLWIYAPQMEQVIAVPFPLVILQRISYGYNGDKTKSCSHQAQWRCRLCPQGAYHLLAIIKIQEHNSGVWNRSECHKRYQHETGYRKAQLGPTYTS